MHRHSAKVADGMGIVKMASLKEDFIVLCMYNAFWNTTEDSRPIQAKCCYTNSECSDEPVHPHSLTRSLIAGIHQEES